MSSLSQLLGGFGAVFQPWHLFPIVVGVFIGVIAGALRFDQPEFFAATFLGLVSVLALSKANLIVSFMSLFIGLALGAVSGFLVFAALAFIIWALIPGLTARASEWIKQLFRQQSALSV